MEQTRNLAFFIFDLCDFDLVGRYIFVTHCTLCHNGDHMCKVILKTFQLFKSYGADMKNVTHGQKDKLMPFL